MEQKLANPAPLGLMGFGMTTVLLNIHNAGFFPVSAMVLAMGMFYGGIAQVIAGILEFKKGNSFGLTAFTSYGMFWLTLVALVGAVTVSTAMLAVGRLTGWEFAVIVVLGAFCGPSVYAVQRGRVKAAAIRYGGRSSAVGSGDTAV